MGSPERISNKNSQKIIVQFVILIGFVFCFIPSLILAQTSSAPISFTKKEIAFFKWGDGEKEIGRHRPTARGVIHKINKKTGKEEPSLNVSDESINSVSLNMKVGGIDKIYLRDSYHRRIFIIPTSGGSISVINNANLYAVDKNGEIISVVSYKDGLADFECIKSTGERAEHKNFKLDLDSVEHGVVRDAIGEKSVTLFVNDNKPEELPPDVSSDIENETNEGFDLKTGKINKHLEKLNRKIGVNKVHIGWELKKGYVAMGYLEGVDDLGDLYVRVIYYEGWIRDDTKTESWFLIFSPQGKVLFRIPLDGILSTGPIIDIHGNFFGCLSANDGVHIYKWEKI